MKIRHPLFVGLVAAFTVSLAIAAASAVAALTPFKGTVNAVETGQVVFPTRFLDRKGTGNATHLGKYTAKFEATVNLACGCSVGDTVHFIAANGDNLYGVGAGSGGPSGTPGARASGG